MKISAPKQMSSTRLTRPTVKKILIAAAVAFPSIAAAQSSPSLEVGYGFFESVNRTGQAISAQAGVQLFSVLKAPVRAELFHQQGTSGDGAGGCKLVYQGTWSCIGTRDRNRISGASLATHIPIGTSGKISGYVPVGVGVYHRNTRTTESAFLAPDCFESDPPTCQTYGPTASSYSSHRTAPGYNLGLGLSTLVGGSTMYAEFRFHQVREAQGFSGSLPISVGVRF